MESNVEQKTGYIVGYRIWRFAYPHFLSSMTASAVWVPLEKHVGINLSNLETMERRDFHGIYAFNSLRALQHNMQTYINIPEYVVGEIALWGRILKHQHGYRAEFGYPLCIYRVPGSNHQALSIIANAYRIPIQDKITDILQARVETRRKEQEAEERKKLAKLLRRKTFIDNEEREEFKKWKRMKETPGEQ